MTGQTAFRALADALRDLRAHHRDRGLALPQGIDFTSNDYLGLSRHPALRAAIVAALDDYGIAGSGGSRLLRGHHPPHAELEESAARFFGVAKALYFGTGFAANLALFSTLTTRHDAVVLDECIHASVKEGVRASAAARYRARHNDPDSFADAMRRAREKGARGLFVAVESVYSMGGDLAPLSDLAALAGRFDAVLVVDEAHATGVLGARGRGLSEGLKDIVTVHTCGKALGVFGALVCGPGTMIEYLLNKARPFIYSTAPPPYVAAGVKRALELVDDEPWRRRRVLELAAKAHAALTRHELARFAGSPILPVILETDERALSVACALQEAGFDVRAIRPPTVPEGTARLRVCIHADHGEDEIAALADALSRALAA
jgi:8-amino-7-oxononanoate synthase